MPLFESQAAEKVKLELTKKLNDLQYQSNLLKDRTNAQQRRINKSISYEEESVNNDFKDQLSDIRGEIINLVRDGVKEGVDFGVFEIEDPTISDFFKKTVNKQKEHLSQYLMAQMQKVSQCQKQLRENPGGTWQDDTTLYEIEDSNPTFFRAGTLFDRYKPNRNNRNEVPARAEKWYIDKLEKLKNELFKSLEKSSIDEHKWKQDHPDLCVSGTIASSTITGGGSMALTAEEDEKVRLAIKQGTEAIKFRKLLNTYKTDIKEGKRIPSVISSSWNALVEAEPTYAFPAGCETGSAKFIHMRQKAKHFETQHLKSALKICTSTDDSNIVRKQFNAAERSNPDTLTTAASDFKEAIVGSGRGADRLVDSSADLDRVFVQQKEAADARIKQSKVVLDNTKQEVNESFSAAKKSVREFFCHLEIWRVQRLASGFKNSAHRLDYMLKRIPEGSDPNEFSVIKRQANTVNMEVAAIKSNFTLPPDGNMYGYKDEEKDKISEDAKAKNKIKQSKVKDFITSVKSLLSNSAFKTGGMQATGAKIGEHLESANQLMKKAEKNTKQTGFTKP